MTQNVIYWATQVAYYLPKKICQTKWVCNHNLAGQELFCENLFGDTIASIILVK